MRIELFLSEQALKDLHNLETDKSLQKQLKAVRKTLAYLEVNPRHPSLNTHKYYSLRGVNNEEVFEAYAENNIKTMVMMALAEDIGSGDITAALIPQHQTSTATVITREKMILCGREWVDEVFRQVDTTLTLAWHANEGEQLEPNEPLFSVKGCSRSILTAERTALNFLQLLSGTASSAHAYAQALQGTQTQLLDTRKTLPLYRQAQKYAVRCGGGKNHRMGLYDAYLIKENHIAACGSISLAIQTARQQHPNKWIEVEVENLMEYEEAIRAKPEVIMLDNFSIDQIKQAVALRVEGIKIEISGNVMLDTIRDYALLGVDFISVGAITKHVRAIDLSMRIV